MFTWIEKSVTWPMMSRKNMLKMGGLMWISRSLVLESLHTAHSHTYMNDALCDVFVIRKVSICSILTNLNWVTTMQGGFQNTSEMSPVLKFETICGYCVYFYKNYSEMSINIPTMQPSLFTSSASRIPRANAPLWRESQSRRFAWHSLPLGAATEKVARYLLYLALHRRRGRLTGHLTTRHYWPNYFTKHE
jgi:hypothetical protein